MPRMSSVERMSYADLIELRDEVEQLIAEKQSEAKAELKAELAALAKEHGFDLEDVVGGNGKGRRGKVAIKYRDPSNPENTWTGRGRQPLWLVAATKKRGVTKEDFEV